MFKLLWFDKMPPEEQHALINTCQPPVLRLYPWCLDGWAVENLADHESVDTKGHQQSFPGLPCPPVGRVSGATPYKNIPQVEGKLQDSWWKTWAIFKQLKLWNYICTLSSRRKKKKTNHQQTKSILKNAFFYCVDDWKIQQVAQKGLKTPSVGILYLNFI